MARPGLPGPFLVVALRWTGPARTIAIVLYAFRLVGFVAFELTDERALLLLFPNVFEFWFIFVAFAGDARVARWSRARIAVALVVLTLPQGGPGVGTPRCAAVRRIGALEFVDLVWRRLTGG